MSEYFGKYIWEEICQNKMCSQRSISFPLTKSSSSQLIKFPESNDRRRFFSISSTDGVWMVVKQILDVALRPLPRLPLTD